MFSQLMGALVGAAIVYANYFHAIDIFEGGRGIRTVPGTAGLFSTYAVCFNPFTAILFIMLISLAFVHDARLDTVFLFRSKFSYVISLSIRLF